MLGAGLLTLVHRGRVGSLLAELLMVGVLASWAVRGLRGRTPWVDLLVSGTAAGALAWGLAGLFLFRREDLDLLRLRDGGFALATGSLAVLAAMALAGAIRRDR